jgi:MFS family permease
MTQPSPDKHDAYAVWKIPNFRWFIMGRFFLTIAIQMQSVIIGWQVYSITKDPFSLGLIGLAEAIPFLSMALFAGHVADKVRRKRIIVSATCIYLICASILLLMSYQVDGSIGLLLLYIVISITGVSRAFFYPAQAAYMAQIVPREFYTNSSTWNSTVWHIAAVSGPALGGLIYGFFNVHIAYALVVIFALISLFMFYKTVSVPVPESEKKDSMLASLTMGIRFVFKQKILLGAMALDMFGVLFGGAVALLPVFADQILHVGAQGLGVLRAAPAFGAVSMSMLLAYYPPLKSTGYKLFAGVTGFGACIILFAISGNFWFSLTLLILSGMFDNISVVIRGTILQLYTPDAMRGRVASVNSIFIGSSNELGSFESGLAARIMGLIPSVIFGGGMTILVVILTSRFVPALKKMELRGN